MHRCGRCGLWQAVVIFVVIFICDWWFRISSVRAPPVLLLHSKQQERYCYSSIYSELQYCTLLLILLFVFFSSHLLSSTFFFSLPPIVVVTQIRAHIAGSPPSPLRFVLRFFYLEKTSALSSGVESCRTAPTHAICSCVTRLLQ